ncbi:MAG: efflux RND transporter periplasmic adaptor subunit [Roseiarcus sp.]
MGDGAPSEIRPRDWGDRERQGSLAWSRRQQIAFVSLVMPTLVFLLVGAPYILSHFVVNPHNRFIYIPPPLGGARALEGHWTDAPLAPVRRVNFGADWSALGWIAADDDLTTNVVPTTTGTVSKVLASVGQAVARDEPLFAIRPHATGAPGGPTQPQEVVVAAPAAGVVTQLDVAVDQDVKSAGAAPATPAVSIADLASVWLAAEIDAADARPLRPGEAVEVRVIGLRGRIFKGRVSSLSPVDPRTMRANVRIVVDNADGAVKPNMLAEFDPTDVEDSGTLAIPEGAVLFENDSTRVFVAAPKESSSDAQGKLTARAIRTGRMRDGMVEVVEGLAAGEYVEASDALFIDRAAKGY